MCQSRWVNLDVLRWVRSHERQSNVGADNWRCEIAELNM